VRDGKDLSLPVDQLLEFLGGRFKWHDLLLLDDKRGGEVCLAPAARSSDS
jgi:hypothetical protein